VAQLIRVQNTARKAGTLHRDLGEDDHPAGRERESDHGDHAHAEAGHEPARDYRAGRDSCREREKGTAV
jgi:hypothetical protein